MKKQAIILFLAVSLFKLSWVASPAQAEVPVIYLNDSGFSDPSAGSWDSLTKTAVLTQDLSAQIEVNANDIILDGNGHTLISDSSGKGVYVRANTGITVKNLKIRKFTFGIYIDGGASNIILANNAISDCFLEGINLGSNNTATGNIVLNNRDGIIVGLGCTIAGNTITFNRQSGILCGYFDGKNLIKDNTVSSSPYGITVSSDDNIIKNNTIFEAFAGIALYYYPINTTVMNNTITSCSYGIWVYSSNNLIFSNTVSSNVHGILVSNNENGVTGNIVNNNTANLNSEGGISLFSVNNNTVTGNILSSNFRGIYLDHSNDNVITGNIASDGPIYGIYLHYSNNNTIAENTLTANRLWGLDILYSINNKIYHNNFMNNVNQAKIQGSSIALSANYWSDYSGQDLYSGLRQDQLGADGIGDTFYAFRSYFSNISQDNFPFMEKDGWLAQGIQSEKSTTISSLTETVFFRKAILNNITIAGDFSGVVNFANLEMLTISTGSFSGKGFFKGQVEVSLDGISYKADWQGALYLKSQENKIYLKGSLTGEIQAVMEGFLSESLPGSGVYDQFEANLKIGRLDTTITSSIIDLKGSLVYQQALEYPLTELSLAQFDFAGSLSGRYNTSLSTVLTQIRINTPDNPYFGEGFSIISYNSTLGSGDGYAYNKVTPEDRTELKGIFTGPILGTAMAVLDENAAPKTLSFKIEKIDLGLPPAPDLRVRVMAPQRISPGQTVDYVIEYRNDGLKAAKNVFVSDYLPLLTKYISASAGVEYNPYAHRLDWKIENLPAKAVGYLTFRVEVAWGLPQGYVLKQNATIINYD